MIARLLVLLLLAAPVSAEAACRLALAFGIDISSSVNAREYRLQLDGLAHALETPEVVAAILNPEGTGIAVAAYEWSGYPQQDMIADWTFLGAEADIRSFANRLRGHRRTYAEYATAVGRAVSFGARLLERAPACARQTLDMSGDGENNDGPDPRFYRRRGYLEGITINGLVVLGAVPDPAAYYREHVIQGPGAFVAQARSFEDYRPAMVGKLLREINQEMIVGERR